MFFDKHEIVRFRVEAETWTDQSPEAPVLPGREASERTARTVPYGIVVSVPCRSLSCRFGRWLAGKSVHQDYRIPRYP